MKAAIETRLAIQDGEKVRYLYVGDKAKILRTTGDPITGTINLISHDYVSVQVGKKAQAIRTVYARNIKDAYRIEENGNG
jgi:hypothetical protein